jgi:hypothetical protein
MDKTFFWLLPKVIDVPEDKTTLLNNDFSASNTAFGTGRSHFYDKLVQKHRNVVEDYSRIEARIQELESQLEPDVIARQL